MSNTKEQGDAREREFLALCELSQCSDDLPTVRTPDRHLDSDGKQLKVEGKRFDFAWVAERVLLELDGGQRATGGGRHNSDGDRWKTLEAQASGWRVVHISYTMLKQYPVFVFELLRKVLDDLFLLRHK